MTDEDWRALVAAVERTRAAVADSHGKDSSPDSQIGPRLAHRRSIQELLRAVHDATARGDAPAWVVRYLSQIAE